MLVTDDVTAGRAEALFTSSMPTDSHPSEAEVDEAVERALAQYGGTAGCAAEVAATYGDYPDTAVLRMRWALRLVAAKCPPFRADRRASDASRHAAAG